METDGYIDKKELRENGLLFFSKKEFLLFQSLIILGILSLLVLNYFVVGYFWECRCIHGCLEYNNIDVPDCRYNGSKKYRTPAEENLTYADQNLSLAEVQKDGS